MDTSPDTIFENSLEYEDAASETPIRGKSASEIPNDDFSKTFVIEVPKNVESKMKMNEKEIEASSLLVDEKSLKSVESLRWVLPSFVGNIEAYLDSECKDPDDAVPVRCNILENGAKIHEPSVFLVQFYLNRLDANQNHSRRSSNIARVCANKSLSGELLFCQIKIAEVEPSHPDKPAYSSFKAIISAKSCGNLHVLESGVGKRMIRSECRKIDWGVVKSKLTPDEPLFVDIIHTIYVHPSKWGLGCSKLEETICNFMDSGRVDWEKEDHFKRIIKKCEELKLFELIECFSSSCDIELLNFE